GALALVFAGIPALWRAVFPGFTSAVGWTIQALLMLACAIGAAVLGARLLGPAPTKGIRAGIFVALVEILAIVAICCAVGDVLEVSFAGPGWMAGAAITAALAVALLLGAVYAFQQPRFERLIMAIEEQGWFTPTAYKRSQGQRVRRGTILGILVLAGC